MTHSPSSTVIEVQNLSKNYGDIKAVNDISFTVQQGEIFGILGPNGAGKTTTLECIEGIVQPTQGSATVLGIDTQRHPENVKQRIGVQLQASAFFDHLTLREILHLFGLFYNRSVSPAELLEKVNLQERANTTVSKLSGGQKQRFSIAATLVNDPEVVFLDEPTTGLDPQARRSLWDFVQAMNTDNRTIVLTTHYMEEAEFLCHRIAIMNNGKIAALDTPANLISSLPVPYEIRVGLANHTPPDALTSLPGVKSTALDQDGIIRLHCSDASTTVPSVLEWASNSGASLTHLEVVPANLEDVFLHITGSALNE